MNTQPPWIEGVARCDFPPLQESLCAEVLVIGGGITGISATHPIARSGFKVTLVERDRIGCGDTAHTTAHLTYMIWSDTAEPFHYLQVNRTTDGVAIVWGGEDHKTGQVVETVDGLPYIGENDDGHFSCIVPSVLTSDASLLGIAVKKLGTAHAMGLGSKRTGSSSPPLPKKI